MKILRIIFLTFVGLVGLVIFWGWFQAFKAFDVSDESFKRDHYKWKLEGMQEYKCMCDLFDGRQFKGEVLSYENPSGAGAPDVIVIRIDGRSDAAFLQNCEIKTYSGKVNCAINNRVLMLKISPRQGPQQLSQGDKVYKLSTNDSIVFEGRDGKQMFNPYYSFDDEYQSCTDLDTMNVRYNLNQFIKYDSLSRVSKPLEPATIDYMNKRIKEQNKSESAFYLF